jgi:hypothetical protein
VARVRTVADARADDALTAREGGLSGGFRQDAGVGVALGVPLAPSFGQFGWLPCPGVVVDGDVVPSDGVVLAAGVGLADGSGLAAETAATPPAMRSAAAMPAVRTVRRKPLARTAGAGVAPSAGVWPLWSAGMTGSSFGSIWISLVRVPLVGTLAPMLGSRRERVLRPPGPGDHARSATAE